MAKEIRVVIDKDGNATVKVDGVKGRQCLKLTDGLVRSLAATPEDIKVEHCAEYWQGGALNFGQAPVSNDLIGD